MGIMKMMMRVEGVMWVKKCPGAKRVIFALFHESRISGYCGFKI